MPANTYPQQMPPKANPIPLKAVMAGVTAGLVFGGAFIGADLIAGGPDAEELRESVSSQEFEGFSFHADGDNIAEKQLNAWGDDLQNLRYDVEKFGGSINNGVRGLGDDALNALTERQQFFAHLEDAATTLNKAEFEAIPGADRIAAAFEDSPIVSAEIDPRTNEIVEILTPREAQQAMRGGNNNISMFLQDDGGIFGAKGNIVQADRDQIVAMTQEYPQWMQNGPFSDVINTIAPEKSGIPAVDANRALGIAGVSTATGGLVAGALAHDAQSKESFSGRGNTQSASAQAGAPTVDLQRQTVGYQGKMMAQALDNSMIR